MVDLKRSKGTGTGAHTSPRAPENRSPRFSDAEPQALPWKGPSSDEGDSGIAQTKAMRMLWGAESYDQTHARGPFGGPFPELVSGLGLVTGRQRVRTHGWVEPNTLNATGNPKRRETNAKGNQREGNPDDTGTTCSVFSPKRVARRKTGSSSQSLASDRSDLS